jgi:hypothetical protein
MAVAITMRMVAQFFFSPTEVTQGPLPSVHYTHIKRTPKSRCAICSGFEDATTMSPRSRGTCLGDLAGDHGGVGVVYNNTIAGGSTSTTGAARAKIYIYIQKNYKHVF